MYVNIHLAACDVLSLVCFASPSAGMTCMSLKDIDNMMFLVSSILIIQWSKLHNMSNFSVVQVILTTFVLLSGCATYVPDNPEFAVLDSRALPKPDIAVQVSGLSPCTTATDTTLHLNSNKPVNIIVHGCFSSAARFRALAQVFAFHGQQTICFNYNDRDSLKSSSSQLVDALQKLTNKLNHRHVTVIGHSQGGLIARSALTRERDKIFKGNEVDIRLVSISSPFSGIKAADHCASPTARVLSLGLVMPVCRLISGDKWYEITRASDFIQKPGQLIDQVKSHVKIVTDEKESCRQYDGSGSCIEDDFVFSLTEQYFNDIDASSRVKNIEISAGHVEIVGDYLTPPEKLIALLQANGIMRHTLPSRRQQLSYLLARLYNEK